MRWYWIFSYACKGRLYNNFKLRAMLVKKNILTFTFNKHYRISVLYFFQKSWLCHIHQQFISWFFYVVLCYLSLIQVKYVIKYLLLILNRSFIINSHLLLSPKPKVWECMNFRDCGGQCRERPYETEGNMGLSIKNDSKECPLHYLKWNVGV